MMTITQCAHYGAIRAYDHDDLLPDVATFTTLNKVAELVSSLLLHQK